MPRKYRPWSRAEYDRLEELVNAGLRYADIAEVMGREILSIQGGAQRIGLMSPDRQGWRRKDWPTLDAMIQDCIEANLMAVPQVARHLNALGHDISAAAVYRRLESLPASIRHRARENGRRRKSSAMSRMRQRQLRQSA